MLSRILSNDFRRSGVLATVLLAILVACLLFASFVSVVA